MNLKSLFSNKWFLAFTFFILYSWLASWQFALVLMATIAFHEHGHLWAARKQKLSTGGFYFIPFMGGVATVTENYKTFGQQAFIGIMGPIWGLFLATVAMFIGMVTHNSFFTLTGSSMAFFNLFNLVPVTFLDGGQLLKTVTVTLSKKYGFLILNVITIITTLTFLYFIPSPLIILAAVISIFQNHQEEKMVQNRNWILPKDLSYKQIVLTIVSWLGTALALIVVFLMSMSYTHDFTGKYLWLVK